MPQNIAHNLEEKPRTRDILINESFNFNSLLLSNTTLQGLKEAGFYKPSPIQLKAIPLGRCGLDLIVQAKSGTGKTAVFTIIALEMVNTTKKALQVLVFAPTREIAMQIEDVIRTIGQAMLGLNVGSFIGGLPIEEDIKKLKNCHIAVGSPGRLKHLVEQSHLKMDSIRLLVLDEADKLMEQCFQSDINYVYRNLPERKQVLALSATYPDKLDQFLANYMQSPTFVTPEVENPILLGLRQFVAIVRSHINVTRQLTIKNEQLICLLSKISFAQCLIFFNSQSLAEGISNTLNKEGWNTTYISAAQSQAKRIKAVNSLKKFECKILLSTDLTARGIDAANVDLVINYDVPFEAATYLHRMGRAGRYGSRGLCVTIAADGFELKRFQCILGEIGGTELGIAKLPSEGSLGEVWECDLNSCEKVYGTINSDGGSDNEDLKNSVFDLKNRKFKNKSDSDIADVMSSDLERLSVDENVNQESCDNDSQTKIQSIKNILLNHKKKIDKEINQKCSGMDTEALLKGLASGENILPTKTNEEQAGYSKTDTELLLKSCDNDGQMEIQSIKNILNRKQKINEDISQKCSGIDTEALLTSLASGENILPTKTNEEQAGRPKIYAELLLKSLAAENSVLSTSVSKKHEEMSPISTATNSASLIKESNKQSESETDPDIINPASLYPWVPVEGSSVLSDTCKGENLLEHSDEENSISDQMSKSQDNRKRKRKHQKKSNLGSKKIVEEPQQNSVLLKNLALYSITQLLTDKDDHPLNYEEEFNIIVNRIGDYLSYIKEKRQLLTNDMLMHFQSCTCSDLLENISQYCKQWSEQQATNINQPFSEEDPLENIFKFGYFYINKTARHWIDELGDKYEPEEETESEVEEDMDIVEEEEDEINYEDNVFENAADWQQNEIYKNKFFKQTIPNNVEGNYSYSNLEWMPSNHDQSNFIAGNTSFEHPYNPTYASYFDYYREILENDALTLEDVPSFNNYLGQWQHQVQTVRDYVQQNIYLQEMNNYQYQRGQYYDYYPSGNNSNPK